MPLIAAARLPKLLVRSRHVEDVVDDLKEHAELGGEAAVEHCLTFWDLTEHQYDAHAGSDQAARLQRVHLPEPIRIDLAPLTRPAGLELGDVDVLAADHPSYAGGRDQL